MKKECRLLVEPWKGSRKSGRVFEASDGKFYIATIITCTAGNVPEAFKSIIDTAKTMIRTEMIEPDKAFTITFKSVY